MRPDTHTHTRTHTYTHTHTHTPMAQTEVIYVAMKLGLRGLKILLIA